MRWVRGSVALATALLVGACSVPGAQPRPPWAWSDADAVAGEPVDAPPEAGPVGPAEPGDDVPGAGSAAADATADQPELAFVRHYIAVLGEARATGDADVMAELRALSAGSCEGCAGVADLVEDVYAAGGGYGGDPRWRVLELGVTPGTAPVVVAATVDIAPYDYRPAAGAQSRPGRSGTFSYEFTVRQKGERWSVVEFDDRT